MYINIFRWYRISNISLNIDIIRYYKLFKLNQESFYWCIKLKLKYILVYSPQIHNSDKNGIQKYKNK